MKVKWRCVEAFRLEPRLGAELELVVELIQ